MSRTSTTTSAATGRFPVVTALLVLALSGLTSGCLPDQFDGRQETIDAQPALDLSWFDEVAALDAIDAGLIAMSEIGSVRLRQAAESGDGIVRKDLLVAIGDGIGDAVDGDCTGTLQLPSWGEPAELVVEDDLGAFRGTTDFWLTFGDELTDVRESLAERYADEWTTTPGLASLCAFSDFLGPVSGVINDDEAYKAGLGDVAGVPAGRVVSKSKKMTVTTWVQIAEPHLILRVGIERRSKEVDGSLGTVTTFSDVDSAVEVDFPAPEEILAFELPSTEAVPPVTNTGVTDE